MNKPKTIFALASASALALVIALSPSALANDNTSGQSQMNHNRSGQSNKPLKHSDVQKTVQKFKHGHGNVADFFNKSYAYAVFPSVGSGAFVIGGAYGEGEVYRNGKLIGYTTITEFNIGAQIGGKTFRELIFFKNKETFHDFTQGNFQFDADMSAVAVKAGVGVTNDFTDGVAVFTMPRGGLMAGVSIGGQKFSYTPVEKVNDEDSY